MGIGGARIGSSMDGAGRVEEGGQGRVILFSWWAVKATWQQSKSRRNKQITVHGRWWRTAEGRSNRSPNQVVITAQLVTTYTCLVI